MDRAPASEVVGRWFESNRRGHLITGEYYEHSKIFTPAVIINTTEDSVCVAAVTKETWDTHKMYDDRHKVNISDHRLLNFDVESENVEITKILNEILFIH